MRDSANGFVFRTHRTASSIADHSRRLVRTGKRFSHDETIASRKRNARLATMLARRRRLRIGIRTLARSPHMAIGKHVFGWILGVPAALLTLIYVLSHL